MIERKRISVPAVVPVRGRPPLQWDDRTKEWVRVMSGFGMSHAEIAAAIKPRCGVDVLRLRFKAELEEGGSEVKGRISRMAMTLLEGRPAEILRDADGEAVLDADGNMQVLREEIKPNVVMAIFLCKVRLGLKDSNVAEQAPSPEQLLDLDKLNPDELKLFEAFLTRVTPKSAQFGAKQDRQTTH